MSYCNPERNVLLMFTDKREKLWTPVQGYLKIEMFKGKLWTGVQRKTMNRSSRENFEQEFKGKLWTGNSERKPIANAHEEN